MLFDSTDMPFRCGQIVTIANNTISPEWSGIRGIITAIHDEYSPGGIPDDGPIEVQFSQQDCPEWMQFDAQGLLTVCFIPYELRI